NCQTGCGYGSLVPARLVHVGIAGPGGGASALCRLMAGTRGLIASAFLHGLPPPMAIAFPAPETDQTSQVRGATRTVEQETRCLAGALCESWEVRDIARALLRR